MLLILVDVAPNSALFVQEIDSVKAFDFYEIKATKLRSATEIRVAQLGSVALWLIFHRLTTLHCAHDAARVRVDQFHMHQPCESNIHQNFHSQIHAHFSH